MGFWRLLGLTVGLIGPAQATSLTTCGQLREAFLGGECCQADENTAVLFGASPPPPPLSTPPSLLAPPGASPPPPYSAPIEVPTNYTGCETTIVGAGAGGLYTAYRLVFDAGVAAASICIFEADARIGGRILSLRNQVRSTIQPHLWRDRCAQERARGAPPRAPFHL